MTWWQNAKVGDRVVCVKQPLKAVSSCYEVKQPRQWNLGAVYRVDGLMPVEWIRPGLVALQIEGRWISASCFRPVQPKSSESGVLALKKTAYLASLKLKVYALSEAG